MVLVTVSIHKRGLHPLAAARTWHLRRKEGMSLNRIRAEVVNMQNQRPSKKAVWNAVQQYDCMQFLQAHCTTEQHNICGVFSRTGIVSNFFSSTDDDRRGKNVWKRYFWWERKSIMGGMRRYGVWAHCSCARLAKRGEDQMMMLT